MVADGSSRRGTANVPRRTLKMVFQEMTLKLLAIMGRIFDRILDSLAWMVNLILAFSMLIVCADVILRYGFNSPIIWQLDVTSSCLVIIAALGMAWLLKEEGHIRVDYFFNRFGSRTQIIITLVTSCLSAVAVGLITWYGLNITIEHAQAGYLEKGILPIPRAALLFPLAAGLFLLFIQFIRRFYKYYGYLKTGKRIELGTGF